MRNKAIQRDLGIFTHIPAYSGIIQAYSGVFRTLCNPGIFRTLTCLEPEAYLEPWYIHRTRCIFRTLALCIFLTRGIFGNLSNIYDGAFTKRVNGYNCFANYNYFCNISFSRSLLYKTNIINFFNTGLILVQKYLFYVKKYGGRGPGAVNLDTSHVKDLR